MSRGDPITAARYIPPRTLLRRSIVRDPTLTTEESGFEFFLQRCPHDMRMALIDVCDTAEMCQRWFEHRQVKYCAADLVAMAALVLNREVVRQQKIACADAE